MPDYAMLRCRFSRRYAMLIAICDGFSLTPAAMPLFCYAMTPAFISLLTLILASPCDYAAITPLMMPYAFISAAAARCDTADCLRRRLFRCHRLIASALC